MSGEASFASALRGVGADGHILPTNPQGQGSSSTNPNAAAGSSSQNTAASQAAGTGGAGAGAGSGAPVKRKRNLPGTPDPEAEVIALSPKTLMATNRFVCEICNKGFQRDQNLQLHRRGHNLPWKLRQRTTKEIKKRVYICPESNCVHHDPSRALGDLTGIKKHYCRKHGEKKWKCDKCSKRYAVQSDWKAHSKTCGTREYRCDCGTLFSRRDSFITHRAFCDALAEESARVSGGGLGAAAGHMGGSSSFNSNPLALGHAPPNAAMAGHVMVAGPPSSPGRSNLMRLGGAVDDQFGLRQSFSGNTFCGAPRPRLSLWFGQGDQNQQSMNAMDVAAVAGNSVQALYAHSPKPILPGGSSDYDESHKPLSSLMNSGSMYPAIFQQNQSDSAAYAWAADNRPPAAARSLSLSTSAGLTTSSASGNSNVNDAGNLPVNSSSYNSQSAQMSATALLQKAAQMGATASNSAFRGFTIPVSGNSASVGLGLSWPTTNEQQQQQQHQRAAVVASQNSQFMKPPMEQMLDQGAGSGFHSSHHPQQLGSARSENSGGLHDLMNSLSGNGLMGIMQQSPFMEDSASFTGLNMIQVRGNMNPNAAAAAAAMKEQVAAVAAAGFQRGGGTGAGGSSASSPSLSSSSSLSQHHHHHHHHNMMSSMQVVPGLLTGMGNPARNSDDAGGSAAAAAAAAEGLTRDFLGVGGVHHQAMQARAFQQHNEQITGNYSGIDITASFNRADDLKSWEAAT